MKKIRNIVMMYHGIGDPGAADGLPGAVDPVYTIDEAIFRNHLALICASALPAVLPGEEPADSPDGTPGPDRGDRLMITFDDGYASDYSIALPLLVENGLRGMFFVTTGWTGSRGYMDEGMIRGLVEAGMAIGSHGETHRYMTDISDGELARELADSKKRLEDITGASVGSLSAPGGRIDGRVAAAAVRAGYRWIFSSSPFINGPLAEGVPAGRFAVTTGRSEDWFRRVIEGRPPATERIRYRTLSILKRLLGNRFYESARKGLLGDK